MADITYESDFNHQPWLAGDLVQAEGENGFNLRLNSIENEFDKISGVVSLINEQINLALQRGVIIEAFDPIPVTLDGQAITEPLTFDNYANADFPNIKKLYQVTIEPVFALPPNSNHGQVSYHLIYELAPGNRTDVSIWFKNERNERTSVNAQVFSISRVLQGDN